MLSQCLKVSWALQTWDSQRIILGPCDQNSLVHMLHANTRAPPAESTASGGEGGPTICMLNKLPQSETPGQAQRTAERYTLVPRLVLFVITKSPVCAVWAPSFVWNDRYENKMTILTVEASASFDIFRDNKRD